MASNSKTFRRFVRHSWLSITLFVFLVGAIFYSAWQITEKYKRMPDFGGIVTLRQGELDLDFNGDTLRLTRGMILKTITDPKHLEPVAARNGWNEPYAELVKRIEVKERLSAQRSFSILVNTMNAERSVKMARALAVVFLNEYQKKWEAHNKINVKKCAEKIRLLELEITELKSSRQKMRKNRELLPISTEIEMEAINNQLVEAQKQFMTAYGAYISKMEEKRSEIQLQYNLARQVYTENDARLQTLKLQLDGIDRLTKELGEKLIRQKPDLYKMTITRKKLTGLPGDVLYFYDNIQTLQQLKLAMMLDSIIEDKTKTLEEERRKKDTVERLIETHSSDVFIREVGI